MFSLVLTVLGGPVTLYKQVGICGDTNSQMKNPVLFTAAQQLQQPAKFFFHILSHHSLRFLKIVVPWCAPLHTEFLLYMNFLVIKRNSILEKILAYVSTSIRLECNVPCQDFWDLFGSTHWEVCRGWWSSTLKGFTDPICEWVNSEHQFTFSPNNHIRQIFLLPPIPYSFIQLVLHACETTPSKSDNSVKLKCICEGIQKSFSEWGFNFLPDFNFLLQLPCLESLGQRREKLLVFFHFTVPC